MLNQNLLYKALLNNQLLPTAKLAKAKQDCLKQGINLETFLIDNKLIKEPDLYQAMAKELRIPYVDLHTTVIRKDILLAVPEPIAESHQLVAYDKDETSVKIAATEPDDLQTIEFLAKKFNSQIDIALTSPTSLKQALQQYHKSLKAEFAELTNPAKPSTPNPDKPAELKKLAEDLPVIRIVDTLLEYAVFERASDIHVEPTEQEVIVRYRVDGLLRDVMSLPKEAQDGLTARIKILANLKLDEHRLPQDGRFKIKTKDYQFSFRVSIIPVFDGEKIVLRLLQESGQALTLEQLGLQPNPLTILKRNIDKPHGMILVTGPTGSGKTTTLYSVLNVLNTNDVNISTIEDPIEYRLPRLNQSQVSPRIGFTFANGLRSLLRQDPDIIMVGEIRDLETAEIAIHAAMTGHLVLSTLHTNDAVGTLPRLLDMGIAPFLVASTTNIIVAQRLVRKICGNCATSYKLNKKNLDDLAKQINLANILSTLKRENVIKTTGKTLENLTFKKGAGCKQCNNQGYRGRLGIYELFEITASVAQLILNRASANELKKEAQKQNMLTMLEDGFIKAVQGITSIEEVLRVTMD
ncbi:GspE/PulE family protein [Patescibacteria group bacterium]|nr:GspE/PulE family protein [Patescibacteria group bacterium]